MSSLARQLEKLSFPGQSLRYDELLIRRASLLFDPRDAADFSKDSLLALALNGLDELFNINRAAFEEFEQSIFSEESKTFQRAQQTREIVANLDRTIELFLRRLSPYVLLKPAHKCLEWLVRAYNIHQCNVDALVECVLPYHETKLFARVVQLLPLRNESSRWHWLLPLQKEGTPLPKAALLQHCVSVPATLTFVCQMIPRAVEAGVSTVRTVVEFCTSTVIGVLEVVVHTIKEDMVARLLPFVLEGLRSSNVDWSEGTMMVISQLCSRVHLDEKLTASLIDIISKNLSEQTVDEYLSCIAYMCQSQSLHQFPKKAAKRLCKKDYMVPSLQKIDSTCRIDKLQRLLLDRLMDMTFSCFVSEQEGSQDIVSSESGHPYCNVLMKLLRSLRLEKGNVVRLVRDLLHRYVSIRGSLDSDSLPQLHVSLRPLVKAIEARYSSEFDDALELHLKELTGRSRQAGSTGEMVSDDSEDETYATGAEEESQWIQELISIVLSGSRHAVVKELSTGTLTLSLHHPNPEVRRLAVLQLDKTIRDVKEDASLDTEFHRDALLARLQDDDPAVVQVVIEMGQRLVDITGCSDLVPPFVHTLGRQLESGRHRDKLWQQVCLSITELITSVSLSSYSPQAQDNILVALLPHLLLLPKTQKYSIKMTTLLTSSTFASQVPLLSDLPQVVSSEAWLQLSDSRPSPAKLAHVNSLLVNCFGSGWLKMMETEKMKLIGLLATCVQKSASYSPLGMITLGLLDCVLPSVQNEQSLLICGLAIELLQPSLITLSTYGYKDIPKSKKEEEISLMPQSIPQSLEEALLPLMVKRRSSQIHRAVQLSSLQLRIASSICRHLCIPTSAKQELWLNLPSTTDPDDQYTLILLQLFDLLLEGSRSQSDVAYFPLFQELLCVFIKHQLGGEGSLIRFIAMLWTIPVSNFQLRLNSFVDLVCRRTTGQQQSVQRRNPVSSVTVARGLLVAVEYLQTRQEAFKAAMMLDECPVIPSFLVALRSPVQTIRELVLQCLDIIYTTALKTRSSSALCDLAGIVCEGAGEIGADSDYICQLLSNALSTSHSKKVKQQSQSLESRISIIKCVMGYVTEDETPLYVKQGILEAVRDVDSQYKLKFSLPFLDALLEKSTKSADMSVEEKRCMKLLVQQYTPATARSIGSEDNLSWSLFEKCLCATGEAMCAQTLALTQVTKNFYKALNGSSFQQQLLSLLCDLATSSTNAESASAVKQVLANIRLKATDIVTELEKVTLKHSSTTPAKRIKSSSTGTKLPKSQVRQLQRALTLLEIVQQERNVRDVHLLIPKLFGMLNQCLLLTDSEEFSFDYVIQLLLSCAISCCEQVAPDGHLRETHLLHEDQFSVELVVQCIRTSKSPQTHQHALLLLNIAAQLFPESVVHKIMPIFTFMGASLLRMDDSYSMQIVKKTVETVVPAVMKATESTSGDCTDLVRTVLRVFVDASPHIPSHRQLPILQHLLETLGVSARLHEMLALLIERCVLHSGNKQEKQMDITLISEEFCLSLVVCFSPLDQATGLTRLLEYIQELPEVKPQASKARKQKKKSCTTLSLFSVETNTAKQLQHFKLACVSLVGSTLASEQYAAKVLELTGDDEHQLESNYLHLLGVTLTLISQTATSCEKYAQEASSKFWRVLLSKEYHVIEKLTCLLSSTALVEVVCQLIQHSNATVRRKAMELFNSHVANTKGKYTPGQIPALLDLVNVLTTLMAPLDTADSDQLLETPLNRQTALYSLKLLARMLGCQQQQQFLPVATACFQIISDKTETYEVVSSALLCVAQHCAVLGPHLIPYLPRFVPAMLNCLLDVGNVDKPRRDLLQLSAATCLLKVVEHLAKFLSLYMVDILQRTCHSSFSLTLCKNSQLSEKLHAVRSLLAKSVPVRVLCPAITDYYTSQLDPTSIAALFCVLGESIQMMTREDTAAYTQPLVNLFTIALGYRTDHLELAQDKVAMVEGSVITAFLELVVKLSENAFRPVFIKLFDWASSKDVAKDRMLTFYRLTSSVAEKLKGLVVLFVSHIFGNCGELLDANNCSKTDSLYFETMSDSESETDENEESSNGRSSDSMIVKSRLLVHSVLGCLHKTFLYASERFITKEMFETLLQPMIDQIENDFGGAGTYEELICGHVVPCVAQFAEVIVDRNLWKALNYQVLLKTRHPSSRIRLGALHVMKQLYVRMGEEFVSLLPETIPFLSEMMEDESEEVEQECQAIIRTLEETLGESLQPYF